MNKTLIVLAIIATVSASFLPREDEAMFKFMKFVREHNREYRSVEEFHERFVIFKENLTKVSNHESFSPFMDHSPQEFKNLLNLNAQAIPAVKAVSEKYLIKNVMGELPATHDWRENGAVGKVKNQGSCGSCWAFSAVGNLEGLYAIKNGKQLIFSEQELVDCDDNGDEGCNGGLMDNAFAWLQKNGGIELESDYKYTGRDGTCKFNKTKVVAEVKGFKDIGQNEEEIRRVLFENGPLSIAVDATDFQFYEGGIKTSCSFYGLNHGVTLVGYSEEDGKKFWIIRNSWGSSWGENGYIRLERGKGLCGMNTAVSTAELK